MYTIIYGSKTEAVKKIMEKIKNKKPLSKEEIREKIHNSDFFKRLKEVAEKVEHVTES